MYSDQEKLKCLGRELALRRAAYPKWVASGRMKQAAATHEIAIIEEIIADYKMRADDDGGI